MTTVTVQVATMLSVLTATDSCLPGTKYKVQSSVKRYGENVFPTKF